MKKKKIDLTGREILKICDSSLCNDCSIRFEYTYCMAEYGVRLFPNLWLEEEIEVEE